MKILLLIAGVCAGLFLLSVIIYWLNLDMKLIHLIYPLMNRHYDTMDRKRLL